MDEPSPVSGAKSGDFPPVSAICRAAIPGSLYYVRFTRAMPDAGEVALIDLESTLDPEASVGAWLSRTQEARLANPFPHVAGALRLSGEIDEAALRAAWADVLARHESLRTITAESYRRVLPKAVSEL